MSGFMSSPTGAGTQLTLLAPPYSQDLYRPLTALLLAVEWMLGHGGALLFRIVSYLLYTGAAPAVDTPAFD
jgi:hypothetical protein